MKEMYNDKKRLTIKKICFRCSKEKTLMEYYRHRQMKDGHLNKCKQCAKDDASKHRDNNLEKIRGYDRERSKLPHRIKHTTENTKKFRQKSPLAYKAHCAVNNAIRDKRLTKPSECSICSKTRQIEGHHDDYTKPLDVVWLCSACHSQLHRDLRKI